MSLVVVVLAGGEGRRIGGGKPLRRLGEERLIDRALGQARGWSSIVAVSLKRPDQVATDVNVILDEQGAEGPLAGLIAAGRFAASRDCGLVLTIPADMPFLPPDLAERLGAAIAGFEAALASSGGQLHPVCGLWRVAAIASAAAYAASGRRSLKGFAATVGFCPVEWPAEPFDPFYNINRSEDLAQAERRLQG